MSKKSAPLLGLQEIVFGGAIIFGIFFYMYRFGTYFQAPETLIGQDFRCEHMRRSVYRTTSTVWGSQDPAALVEFLRKDSQFGSVHTTTEAVVNLAHTGNLDSDPLTVHVLAIDQTASDMPLLSVRVLNKLHQGETWYIAASNVNRETKVNK